MKFRIGNFLCISLILKRFLAIPIIDGTRPYQQVRFQYSLHIMTKNGNISHKEF